MSTAGGGVLTFDLNDLIEAEIMFRKVADKGGKVQKAVNKASSKATQVLKRSIKQEVQSQKLVRTGTMKKNIVIKAERSQYKGKKVRQVTMRGGAVANGELQKPIDNPGELGGSNSYAYYPASIEYGFLARAKGGGVQYVEGWHFMKTGAELVSEQVQDVTVDTMMKELDKLWQEASNG